MTTSKKLLKLCKSGPVANAIVVQALLNMANEIDGGLFRVGGVHMIPSDIAQRWSDEVKQMFKQDELFKHQPQ